MKKIRAKTLNKIFDGLKNDPEKAVGSYLFRGYRVQVSKYNENGSERVLRLYNRRRKEGVCVICGKKVIKTNVYTKKKYRKCEKHRLQENNRG